MTTVNREVYFVYDGGCPFCSMAARYFVMKKSLGNLILLSARDNSQHPVIREINKLALDLDEGIVIKFNDVFYHGADALHMMALISTRSGLFNRFNAIVFRSPFLSKIFYPLFKQARNFALWCKNIGKINNLGK